VVRQFRCPYLLCECVSVMLCDVSALINGIVKFVLDRWSLRRTWELQLKITWWLVTEGEGIFSALSIISSSSSLSDGISYDLPYGFHDWDDCR
jgi:hypothetical protein